MTKLQAEQQTLEYIQPIYGFTLKHCKTAQDAKDLAQEIALRIFRVLLKRDDIEDIGKFVWTVAHNALANYYRDKGRRVIVGLTEEIADATNMESDILMQETLDKLYEEIAYLSKLQRRIVIAYYYENKRQEEIANELRIPIGTVKWHLFEAKKELKRGMDSMRTNKELKFNPISFSLMGFNGSAGTMGGTQGFFRSALSQNIAYCVYRKERSVNEIADILGVSPVYVESEVEFLEKYGYLLKKGEKYLANMLIEDNTDARCEVISRLHEELYSKATELFANQLYDELMKSLIMEEDGIECCYKSDKNYLLWALIPYICALSGDGNREEQIAFEEVATMRPDGAHDIANVTIGSDLLSKRKYYDSIMQWCGPSWSGDGERMLWCCRSEWTDRKSMQKFWDYVSPKSVKLLCRLQKSEALSVDEYTFLVEQGFIKMKDRAPVLQIVWPRDKEIKERLLAIGAKIKEKNKEKFEKLKEPFVKAVLEYTPKHLRKLQAYQLQYIFYSDGWFLLYSLKELVNSGKLKLPTEEQRKSLMTLVVPT